MRSLLWPLGRRPAAELVRLDDGAMRDLELHAVVDWLSEERPDRRPAVLDALGHLPADAETVRWRAGAVADLLESASLCDRLSGAVRALRLMVAHRAQVFGKEVPHAARIGARVVELTAYVDAVELLRAALRGQGVRSEALAALASDIEGIAVTAEFAALRQELPIWRHTLDEVRSVTVTINVSGAMEPESAVIVGFGPRQAEAADAALSRLLGEAAGERGLVRLFRRQPVDWRGKGQTVADVQALLEAVAAPLERALVRYRMLNVQALASLEDELVLLLGAARLGRRWRAQGLPCCIAEVEGDVGAGPDLPGETHLEGAFHPVLLAALPHPSDLVCNDVTFGGAAGERGRVWVLTGPNRGGKTSYLRAAGVAQVLGQCGLPEPARRARLCVVDHIFTHFPVAEMGRAGQGRLDEEAARMARIFESCTPRSLVLLNEVLAGTSAPEGMALAADVLSGFRAVGCSVLYATHLHELSAQCAEINASVDGPGRVASLTVQVAIEVQQGRPVRRPTYRVVAGEPSRASFFASEIARQHGIALDQLLAQLARRGVLPCEREGNGRA